MISRLQERCLSRGAKVSAPAVEPATDNNKCEDKQTDEQSVVLDIDAMFDCGAKRR